MWALGKDDFHDDKLNAIYGNSRLKEDGYCLIMLNDSMKKEDNFNFINDFNNYRKPFFILRFDNIPINHNYKYNGNPPALPGDPKSLTFQGI
jgi:hypothetical protein